MLSDKRYLAAILALALLTVQAAHCQDDVESKVHAPLEEENLNQESEQVEESRDSRPSPCDGVRCGYGAQCEVSRGRARCECQTFCPLIYMPVCGSDRRLYSNECTLRLATCKSRGRIQQAPESVCSGKHKVSSKDSEE